MTTSFSSSLLFSSLTRKEQKEKNLYCPPSLSLPALKIVEDPEAQIPEVAGECADTGLGVALGGEGLQRTL